MEQHPTASANPPRGKRRRKRAAKSDVADAPAGPWTTKEFEQAGTPKEPSDRATERPEQAGETPVPDRSAASDVDETHFANVTASLIERGRHDVASVQADSSKAEPQKRAFLNSTATPSLFVYKGKAKPSLIKSPRAAPAESQKPDADDRDPQAGVDVESGTPVAEAEHHREAAEAKPIVDQELQHLRREVSTLQASLAERDTALAEAMSNLEQVRARREQEKSAEAERVAQMEAEWRDKLERSLSEAHAESDSAHDQAQKEMAKLQCEAAMLHSTLQERERALTDAASAHQQSLKKSQREAEDARRKAEQAWKDAEKVGIAEVEARWQEAEAKWRAQATSALAEVGAEAEAARNRADEELRRLSDQLATVQGTITDREKALAKASLEREQVREQAEAVRNRTDAEIRNLNGQLGRLRGTVADRDKALAKAAADMEQARAQSASEMEQVRAQAVSEMERFRAKTVSAMEQFRAQTEAARQHAEGEIRTLTDQRTALQTTLADREKALAKALSETKQVREQADGARHRAEADIEKLNDQLAATIADREAALARAATETERVSEQGRQDLQAVIERAEAREAGESARLAAAEAKWRQQSGAALNEATARYQAAEGMLTQMRQQADRARTDAVGGSIKSGGAPFGARNAQREAEPAPVHVQTHMPTRAELGLETRETKVVLRPKRILAEHDVATPRKRRAGLLLVAALAVVAVVAYPKIEPLLPYNLRVALKGVAASTQSASPPSTPTQRSALVTAEVNLRAGPSRTAAVVAKLPRGQKVAVFDTRDDWMLVQVEGGPGNAQRQGWVFRSFLEDVPEVQAAR